VGQERRIHNQRPAPKTKALPPLPIDFAEFTRKALSLDAGRSQSAVRRKYAGERTEHCRAAAIQHMRVDLSRAHVSVAELLLHRANIHASL